MSKRVAFITGATGFAGSHLAARLLKDGWNVRALVRDRSRMPELEKLGMVPVHGDLAEPDSYGAVLEGVDTVFHIAALYRRQGSRKDHFLVNTQGTSRLLEAAVRSHVAQFLYCSTVGVHSAITGIADELAPIQPGDRYQESKWEAEKTVRHYLQSGKIGGSIFRPVAIYGPGDLRFLKVFRMVQAPVTLMPGSGKHLYHMIYIDDLVDGILLCQSKAEAQGDTFILAGDSQITLNDLYRQTAVAMNKTLRLVHIPLFPFLWLAFLCETVLPPLGIAPPFYRRRMDFFMKNRAFTNTKARERLGFTPKVTMEEGLRKTAEWYRQQHLLRNAT